MGILEVRLQSSALLLIATPGVLSKTVVRAGDKAGLRVALARLPADRAALGTLRRQWPRLVPGISPLAIQHIDLVAQLSRMIRNRQLVAALLYDNGVEVPEAKLARGAAAAIHLSYPGGVLLLGRRGALPVENEAPRAAVQTILRGLGSTGLRTIETAWPSVFGGSPPGSGASLLQHLDRGMSNGDVVARLLPGPSGAITASLRADAPRPITTWSSLDKIAEAIPRSGKFLSGDLKAFVAIFRDPMVAVKMAGGMLALLALQAVPVVGAAVDTAILITLAWTIGWEAGTCIDALVRATIAAVDATEEADLDRAARLYANAFEAMGTAALSALTARFMLRTRAAAAAEADAAAAAKRADEVAARTRPPPHPTTPPPPPPPKARAGPSTMLGSEEAVASKRVYAEAFNAKEDLVIGRLPDTKAGSEMGMRRLDSPFWNLKVNDAWVQGGIDANKPFYLGSNPTIANLRSADAQYPTTVFMRELQQLKAAGYTRQGMWLLPPTRP